MKLPKRGMLVDTDGKVRWMWARNGQPADWEYHDICPVSVNPVTGEVINTAAPGDVVIDLEGITEPGDMMDLHADHKHLRWKKDAQGQWSAWQNIAPPGEPEEHVKHRLQHRIEQKRKG
jgi:hypothetical protein